MIETENSVTEIIDVIEFIPQSFTILICEGVEALVDSEVRSEWNNVSSRHSVQKHVPSTAKTVG